MGKYCLFVLFLLNIPVNSYGHVGLVTSDFVGLLPDIGMNDTSSPANKHCPKQLSYMKGWSGIALILDRLIERAKSVRSSAQRYIAAHQFLQAPIGKGLG